MEKKQSNINNVFVISAPSGAGKSSLVDALCKLDPRIQVSISHTTRTPRIGETNGVEYFFTNKNQFNQDIEQGKFLEYADVFGNYYGTRIDTITNFLENGYDTILEIDWQGAAQVRQIMPTSVSIFILPPSIEALRLRLESRNTDSKEVIEQRLSQAADDMSHVNEFDHIIINDNFTTALQDLYSIIRSYRLSKNKS